jgi:hypothetical protein
MIVLHDSLDVLPIVLASGVLSAAAIFHISARLPGRIRSFPYLPLAITERGATSAPGRIRLGLMVAIAALLWPSLASANIQLTNTNVAAQDYLAAFDGTPIKGFDFIAKPIDFKKGGKDGVLRSQVFKGKGDNKDLYAYLYQIVTPEKYVIDGLIIDSFSGGPQRAKIANKDKVDPNSIYISDVDDKKNKIGGFQIAGSVKPSDVVSGLIKGENIVAFSFEKPDIPKGGGDKGTSYIFGVFSKDAPRKFDVQVNSGEKIFDQVESYAPIKTPEPSTLAVFLVGGLGLAYARRFGGGRVPART